MSGSGATGLTAGGIAFLAIAWGSIAGLCGWCLFKVLGSRRR